jgi:DNA-binding transcriptional MerR regulator
VRPGIAVARRSAAGYRLYDEEAVARLSLVRALRELGLGLEAITAVLGRKQTLAEVARAHISALDAQLRTLRVQRALLAAAVRNETTAKEMTMIQRFATLSAAEKRETLERFVSRTFEGLSLEGPTAQIAAAMHGAASTLPDDPTDAQLDAWIELAELVSDEAFGARVREMALAGARRDAPPNPHAPDPQRVRELVSPALAAGVAPESARGRAILDQLVPTQLSGTERRTLREQLATFTDARVERYWQLLGVLGGRAPFPATVPLYVWLLSALEASERADTQ